MAEFAKAGVGNTALGLSIGALAGELLGGNWGNILGGRSCGCSEDHYVNRYEASKDAEIARLQSQIELRDANTFAMNKLGELRDYVDHKFSYIDRELCDQKVYNATNTATLSCISGQIAQLMGLTKTIIPLTNVCPEPMPAANSWVAPTTT